MAYHLTYLKNNNTEPLCLERIHRNELVYLFPNRGKYVAVSSLVTDEGVRKCIMPIDIARNHHYRQTLLDIGYRNLKVLVGHEN